MSLVKWFIILLLLIAGLTLSSSARSAPAVASCQPYKVTYHFAISEQFGTSEEFLIREALVIWQRDSLGYITFVEGFGANQILIDRAVGQTETLLLETAGFSTRGLTALYADGSSHIYLLPHLVKEPRVFLYTALHEIGHAVIHRVHHRDYSGDTVLNAHIPEQMHTIPHIPLSDMGEWFVGHCKVLP